jgi:hypothetical protein
LEKRMGEIEAAGGDGGTLMVLSQHLAQFDMAGVIAMLEEMEVTPEAVPARAVDAKSDAVLAHEREGSDVVA